MNHASNDIRAGLENIQRRRRPKVDLGHHNYISLSILSDWIESVALKAASGRMLDFGCGGQPYRELFEPFVREYIGADVCGAKGGRLDVELVPGEPVPFPDASFDTILSTQVLEHVPDPFFYMAEVGRLLRPGGALILTAPMQWRQHEAPFDYFRFTRYGLEELVRRYGMRVEIATAGGGVFAMLGQIYLGYRTQAGKRSVWVNRVVNSVAMVLDRRYPDPDETMNWMLIARKQDAC